MRSQYRGNCKNHLASRSPWRYRGGIVSDNPTFRMLNTSVQPPSIANLPLHLTINNTTKLSSFSYIGGQATSTTWPAYGGFGTTHTLQAGTAPTYNDGSPLLGSLDDSVKFNAGGYYLCDNTTCGDIATEDIVFEIFFRTGDMVANQGLVAKGNAASTIGWLAYLSTTALVFYLRPGVAVTVTSPALTAYTWYHAIFFCDRSGSGICYLDAVAGAANSLATVTATMSTTTAMQIGTSKFAVAVPNLACIASCYLWLGEGWLDTHLQATVASTRFARVSGLYPQVAKGTALPTVNTRTTVGYLRKKVSGTTKLYQMGANWPRVEQITDSNGTEFRGLLQESGITNNIAVSENWDSWSKNDAGDSVSANATAAPNGIVNAAGIICDASVGGHFWSRNTPNNLTVATWCFSVFVKPGDHSWVQILDATVANANCYFNVTTGVAGTKGAGATTSGIEGPYTGGWYRCWITFTGTVALHNMRVILANADGDANGVGDGVTVNLYFWGAQVEPGSYPSSYVSSIPSPIPRGTDTLYFKGDDGNLGGVGSQLQGTAYAEILFPSYDLPVDATILSLNDGGAAADQIVLSLDAATDALKLTTAATAGNAGSITGTTDLVAGTIKLVRCTWRTNREKIYVGSITEGTPDTSCDIPNDLDRINIGSNTTGASQLGGLIRDIKIYKRFGIIPSS